LRRHFGRADVRRFYREQYKIEVDIAVSGNVAALVAVRDHSSNQNARVNAARALRLEQQEMGEPKYSNQIAPQLPGVTIVLMRSDGSTEPLDPPIDVTPAPQLEHEPSPHAWPSVD